MDNLATRVNLLTTFTTLIPNTGPRVLQRLEGAHVGFLRKVTINQAKRVEGWVLAAGDGINSPTGSGEAAAPDICGEATGDGGGVCGPTAYF